MACSARKAAIIVCTALLATGCFVTDEEKLDGEECEFQSDCVNACIMPIGEPLGVGVCGPKRTFGQTCTRPGFASHDCQIGLYCSSTSKTCKNNTSSSSSSGGGSSSSGSSTSGSSSGGNSTSSSSGGGTCDWLTWTKCVTVVEAKQGTRCGTPDSAEVTVRNDCSKALKLQICIHSTTRKNGWMCEPDGTFGSGTKPGKKHGWYHCHSGGKFVLGAMPIDAYNNSKCSFWKSPP